MYKKMPVFLWLFLSIKMFSQNADTALIEFNKSLFYYIKSEGNPNIIIFLHGGVSNPVFSQTEETPGINYLLENNQGFIPSALNQKFDILIPIKNDSLNWLTNHNYCFKTIRSFLDSNKAKYDNYFISGFSDGGTGSYKIFYDNKEYFNGLIVFNGYPQHKNFNKSVNYSDVNNKKVIFFSTFDDNVIPYEFALTEYSKQKSSNPDTYLYITKGKHTFEAYQPKDFTALFDMVSTVPDNKETKNIHAYIRNDKVVGFYDFRKKIYRKYNYEKDIFEENKRQRSIYAK